MDNELLESLRRYFAHLHSYGYMSFCNTRVLLILIFILEFLEKYQGMYTEKDLRNIQNILTCFLGKSCLYIPLEHINQIDFLGVGNGYNEADPEALYRITEDSVLRDTEYLELLRSPLIN